MLRVRLICVGRLKEKFYSAAFAEYEKRLSRYCSFELCELPESGDLRREGASIRERIPAGARVICFCIEGSLMDSEALAALLRSWTVQGCSRLCLVIGGSEGLDESVKGLAQLRLSMSPMTFPPHLARSMAAEQLYRAFTINEGGKYHK